MMEIIRTKTFRKWELSLKDGRARAAVIARITRLASGLVGDVKPIGGGISELRIHYGAGYRIYFQQHDKKIILLLCGGDKSTQQKDIQKAGQIAKQWRDEND